MPYSASNELRIEPIHEVPLPVSDSIELNPGILNAMADAMFQLSPQSETLIDLLQGHPFPRIPGFANQMAERNKERRENEHTSVYSQSVNRVVATTYEVLAGLWQSDYNIGQTVAKLQLEKPQSLALAEAVNILARPPIDVEPLRWNINLAEHIATRITQAVYLQQVEGNQKINIAPSQRKQIVEQVISYQSKLWRNAFAAGTYRECGWDFATKSTASAEYGVNPTIGFILEKLNFPPNALHYRSPLLSMGYEISSWMQSEFKNIRANHGAAPELEEWQLANNPRMQLNYTPSHVFIDLDSEPGSPLVIIIDEQVDPTSEGYGEEVINTLLPNYFQQIGRLKNNNNYRIVSANPGSDDQYTPKVIRIRLGKYTTQADIETWVRNRDLWDGNYVSQRQLTFQEMSAIKSKVMSDFSVKGKRLTAFVRQEFEKRLRGARLLIPNTLRIKNLTPEQQNPDKAATLSHIIYSALQRKEKIKEIMHANYKAGIDEQMLSAVISEWIADEGDYYARKSTREI
jgi:hypothetical protein